MALSEPVEFGRYRLLSLLGQGAMARVYKAQLAGPMSFKKTVAVKRIDRQITADDKLVKALINEALLGGTLRHKNIVEIYEFGDVGGEYFMAMEYVEGWTLDTILGNCRTEGRWVPRSVVVGLLEQILRGLAYAHDLQDEEGRPQNLVHRDLKPANLMLSTTGDLKVMDFGIAKADSNLYKTGAADIVKGTPVYMSPEQIRNERLDRRSDLFSIGSVLHEMITLQVPFQGDSLVQIIGAIMKGDISQPQARVARRFPEMEAMLARLMAPDREARFAAAQEALATLEEIKPTLEISPTLGEWLQSIRATLPRPREHGDFGPDGPPSPLTLAGQEVPSARVGTAPVEAPRPRRTTQAGVAPVAPTRKKARRRDGRGSAGWIVAGLLTLAGGAGVWWTKTQAPQEDPSRREATREVTAPPVVSAPPPAELPASDAVVVPAPTPAPTEPAVHKKAAPAAVPETTPVIEVVPPPTPPAPVGMGKLDLNSQPWSNVKVDGQPIGIVPIRGLELAEGSHTVVFDCGPCEPAASKTVEVLVNAGETTQKVVQF